MCCILKEQRLERNKNRGSLKARKQRYNTLRSCYTNSKQRKVAGKTMSFDITLEQYLGLFSETCFYGDTKDGEMSMGVPIWLGLERLDNSRGHDFDNVKLACGFHNGLRGDLFTVEEMFTLLNTFPRLKPCRESFTQQHLRAAHARKKAALFELFEPYKLEE